MTRDELLDRLETSWQRLRSKLDKLAPEDFDRELEGGGTVRERIAVAAFWNETCAPVFAWARSVPLDQVRQRLETTHHKAIGAINSLTDAKFAPGGGKSNDVPAEHPWAKLTNNERLLAKATDCTYVLYDELAERLG